MWIEDLFTTTLLSDGRLRMNHLWDWFKFRRLIDAPLDN